MLSFIGDHLRANNGKSPTLVEVGKACGINSTGTTHRYLKSLEKKGRLTRSGGWRTIQARGVLPFLGKVT